MNVVGLDLSLTATGVATERGTEVLRTDLRGCDRLAWIRDAILPACGCWHNSEGWNPDPHDARLADLVVLEDYAYGRSNQAHQIGELHGVIRLAFHEAGIPVALVAPTARAKYATGKGNAGKAEVLAAAIRRLGYDGHDDNEADALWLRQMAIDHYGLTTEPSAPMPAVNRAALDKVDWPEIGGEVLEVAAPLRSPLQPLMGPGPCLTPWTLTSPSGIFSGHDEQSPNSKREYGNTEAEALREALRIAVEGLDRVERWYVCKNVPDDDGDFITCRGFTDDSTGWCGWCAALDAIEAVRELVDLGEKP